MRPSPERDVHTHGAGRPAEGAGEHLSLADLLTDLLHLGRRRLGVVALAMVVVVIAGSVAVAIQERRYSATARILVHLKAPAVLDKMKEVVDETGGLTPMIAEKFYHTQEEIITGRSTAERAVTRLGLTHDPTFVGPLVDEKTGVPATEEALLLRAQVKLRRQTQLRPSPDSQIYDIIVTDPDPSRAAELANALAEEYRDFSGALRRDLTSSAADWLEGQIETQREALETSEQAIQEFTRESGLETTTIAEWRNATAERVAEAGRALAVVQRERIKAQSQAESLRDWIAAGKDPAAHPLLVEDKEILGLNEGVLELERKVTRDAARYGPLFPGQASDRDELRVLKERLAAVVSQRVDGIESALARSAEEERLLVEKLADESARAQELGSLEIEWNRRRREAETNAAMYETVLRRAKEANLARNIESSNVNILERATVPPKPSHPRMMLSAVSILLAALLFGALAALIVENLDNTLRHPRELETTFNQWLLGVLPQVDMTTQRELVGLSAPRSAAAECLRAVRTNLLFLANERRVRRIVITSAAPREGKTTICLNLAATMALAGHRAVVVDTDMRRPQIHRALGLDGNMGIVDVLVGTATLREVVQRTKADGLDVIPCGVPPPNPAEMLSSRAFDEIIEALSSMYDYVIFDSPPVLAVTDASILSQKVDGTIVVVRVGQTERRQLRETLRTLDSIRANILGMISNGIDIRRPGYGYGRGYGYGSRTYYGEDDASANSPGGASPPSSGVAS